MMRPLVSIFLVLAMPIGAQPPGAGAPKPAAPNARLAAPFDPSGYWVAQITEDWHYRIKPAAKGDVGGIPVNAQGRRAAAAWDPEKDAAASDACKAYGVGGILRMPGRLHIAWEGDNALKMETDSGTQTRTLTFGQPGGQGGDWQGVSVASWDRQAPALSGFTLGNAGGSAPSLKIVTTKAKPGYLARNGVPYGANATFTEYYDVLQVPGGDALLVVTVEVTDPEYLTSSYWYSVHFKKQADAAGWNPRSCSAK
ncbi:MAG: hypothetical protein ABI811_19895 [Acidobacteriota bacterium]